MPCKFLDLRLQTQVNVTKSGIENIIKRAGVLKPASENIPNK
jgi:hypothetical protein